MEKIIRICGWICVTCVILFHSCKKESVPAENEVYFPRIKAIISDHCLSCHSSAGFWEGRPTAFDTDSEIVAGHASIKAAVVDPVSMTNKRMPKDGSLSQSDIDVIVKWNAKGGKTTD